MAIIQPEEMDFRDKKFSMIISGPPGIGKTTLALSAPNPILVDFDGGVSRVAARHRKTTISIERYEELLSDMESPAFQEAETVVLDTGGSLITYLQDWAMRQNPSQNRKKGGGISMQGFGAVKAEFIRLTNELKTIQGKNIIYIFHTVEEKDKDNTRQRLMCEGSARNIVWQPCDLGCFLQIVDGERYMGFSPTEAYFAKGCYGIHGLIRVPQLEEDVPNDLLTHLFAAARENIAKETQQYGKAREAYEQAMAAGRALVGEVEDGPSATGAMGKIKAIPHALTSEREVKALFSARVKELGLVWNKEARQYERRD